MNAKKEKTEAVVSGTLYQKYRPQSFEEVLGQGEVVQSLQKSIENKKIAHAYLFTGGRGSGKTSTARIFAQGMGVSAHDLYEIDAASNRGIDQIRELRNSVEILPLESSHKVFIIDEVHMLTKEAFNALLKTLEEPPKHVIFILATTEKHKVLNTIVSRCQVLHFKKAGMSELIELIQSVCEKEKVIIDKDSVRYIAQLGDGSFRDTLSQLQKFISLFGKKIIFTSIQGMSVSPEEGLVRRFVENLASQEKESLYKIYSEVVDQGIDIEAFASEILKEIRTILLVQNSNEFKVLYTEKYSLEDIQEFENMKGVNALHLKNFLEVVDVIKQTENKNAAFEVLLYDLIK